jgi:hypothetical protein
LLLLLLLQNGRFIQERMDLHQELGAGFDQIIAAADKANGAGKELIVVNFPSWFAAKERGYALGHEGVLFWPHYFPPGLLTAVHTGTFGDLRFVRVDALAPDLEERYYGLAGEPPDWQAQAAIPSQVVVTNYGAEGLSLLPGGQLGVERNDTTAYQALFQTAAANSPLKLLEASAVLGESGVRVDLVWEAAQALPDTTIFVHLVDEQGNLIAQADGEALGGSYPFELWADGELVLDTRWLQTFAGQPAAVRVGLYNRLSGERLPAFQANGDPWPDNGVTVEVDSWRS